MSERMYPGMSREEKTTFAPYSAFDIPADLRQLHGRYGAVAIDHMHTATPTGQHQAPVRRDLEILDEVEVGGKLRVE